MVKHRDILMVEFMIGLVGTAILYVLGLGMQEAGLSTASSAAFYLGTAFFAMTWLCHPTVYETICTGADRLRGHYKAND